MGFSNSWLAIKNKTTSEVLLELNLKRTGVFEDYPESLITITELPSKWLLLFTEIDHPSTQSENLSTLSHGCEILVCVVEEHVMYSSAEFWEDGQKIWSIQHDAQASIDNINTFGLLPSCYEVIYKQYAEEQESAGGNEADVDMFFEIPLQVANEMVGFKHDETDLEEESFEVLESLLPPSQNTIKTESNSSKPEKNIIKTKSWWQFW